MEALNQPSRLSSFRAASPYPEPSESSIMTDSKMLFDVHVHNNSRLEYQYDEPMTGKSGVVQRFRIESTRTGPRLVVRYC